MPVERHSIRDRAQWLQLRSNDLTASDIAASQGLDPYKSALQLYAEKTGLIDGVADNALMRRGRWLEAAVIAALIDERPELRVKYPLDVYLRDPELRLGCTPDALAELRMSAGGDGSLINVQCKVVAKPEFERSWQDGPPLGYQLQTATEGLLLDAASSLIAALVIDSYSAELQLYPVERHAGAEAKIRSIATTFWDNVRTGRRPAADYSRDAATIAAMFPQSEPEPVLDLSGDNRLPDLLAQRSMMRMEIGTLQAAIDTIDTEIKAKMGSHERAELPGWRLSWKTTHVNDKVIRAYDYRPLKVTDRREKEPAT